MPLNNKTKVRRPGRLIARSADDRFMVVPIGRDWRWLGDSYARLMDAPWRYLMIFIAAGYMGINVIFAILYMLGGNVIENARPNHLSDVFFFSVQTFATIGYGRMAPLGVYANILVTIEAFMGFAFYAMTTGLVFSKFSRPTARIMFSNVAVVAPYHGVPHLMLRMANERRNRIVDARAQLVLWQDEEPGEITRPRRYIDLPLVRSQVPLMQLAWMVMHKIDEKSPLFGMSVEKLEAMNSEMIVSLTGLDESLGQNIHTRFSYLPDEILFNQVFEDVVLRREDRKIEVHYNKFHSVKPVESFISPKPMPKIEDDPAFADLMNVCDPR